MIPIKTLIAVPCMQSVPTKFLRSLENMRRTPDCYTSVSENTLIHDARNDFASIAIMNDFDRVLWIDSDMVFEPDLLLRLSKHLDDGADMVTGLCFKRVYPTEPTLIKSMHDVTDEHGEYVQLEKYLDYPSGQVFPVAACGFAAVMTSVPLLKAAWDKFGPPFCYHKNLGEDFSFCWRVNQLHRKILCDSSIRVGHVGQIVYGENMYRPEEYPKPPVQTDRKE